MDNVRDTFWGYIFEAAKRDHNIVLVSADLAAPALDQFRKEIPSQFVSVGIAEQTAITVAAGLAKEGKHVYVYACSPFIFMRCYEQIKLAIADTGLPVTIVGQGYGMCYVESGVTHHILEDIGAVRMLPLIRIYTASDAVMADKIAEISLTSNIPLYVRLDRPMPAKLYAEISESDMNNGYKEIFKGGETLICANGHVLHFAKEIATELREKGIHVGVADVFGINVNEDNFAALLGNYKRVFVLEEHAETGGLGSYIAEICMDKHIFFELKKYGLRSKDGYIHKYGTR